MPTPGRYGFFPKEAVIKVDLLGSGILTRSSLALNSRGGARPIRLEPDSDALLHRIAQLKEELDLNALVERDGRARSFRMANVTADNLKGAIRRNVDSDARLMTDGLASYQGLGREFTSHDVIQHHRGEYARPT